MLNKKIILDNDNYIIVDNRKIKLVENESKFWNVFILIALLIGCYFKIIPIWGYIIITFVVLFFSLLKAVTVIDIIQNTIHKTIILSLFNLILTKRLIAKTLTHTTFISEVIETPPNEGSSMTLFTISINDIKEKKLVVLIQLDNKNGADLAKKTLQKYGFIFE